MDPDKEIRENDIDGYREACSQKELQHWPQGEIKLQAVIDAIAAGDIPAICTGLITDNPRRTR